MDIKNTIIFSDMDGTLLTSWDKGPIIPPNNIISIKKWLNDGGLFSVATGRNLKNVPEYFRNLYIKVPMVLVNGALIYLQTTNEIIHQEKIPINFFKEAVDYFILHKYIALVLSDEYEVYSVIHQDSNLDIELDFPTRPISINDVFKINVLKVTLVVTSEYAEQVYKDVKNFKTINEVNVLPSSLRFIEMVSHKATKAIGIGLALDYINLKNKFLICIGDYLNDIEMLEIANLSAAPLNAHHDLKKIANIITVSNNEGAIADLIDKISVK